MTRTGRLIRQGQRAAALCVNCAHPLREHTELPWDSPHYRPALFVCRHKLGAGVRFAGCDCQVDAG